MTKPPDQPLELLLSDAEQRMPVLERGLPESALAAAAPPSEPRGSGSLYLDAPDRDPNLLDQQRWGVIAPEGAEGDRLLGAAAALIEHRRREQGVAPRIFRAPAGLDVAGSIRWRDTVVRAESLPEHERPRYLLMLGDLEQVSLELQHTLAHGAFVGRLALASEAAIGAYCDKVIGWERGSRELPRALYYTAQDGTSAISAGYRHLMQPCVEMADRWREAGKLQLADSITIPHNDDGPEALLAEAARSETSVLLSLSHGLGAPRRGWSSPAEQRRRQGALCLGLDAEPLDAAALGQGAFLPGGIWFMVACFGAGTPASSAYYPWLSALAGQGGEAQAAREVLRSLPRPGEPPFLAALPQAALANPKGPLAVIGHVDLAWTFAFMDNGRGSRASRIFGALRALLAGSRAGVALDVLMQAYREANDDLGAGYQLQRDAAVRGQDDPTDNLKLARLWMRRNDLRGYVVLGDPAVHLPLARARARVGEPAMSSMLIDLRKPQRPMIVGEAPAQPVPRDISPRPEPPPAEPASFSAPAREPAASPSPAPPPAAPAAATPALVSPPAAPAVEAAPTPAPSRPAASSPTLRSRERAVLALLRGGEAPQQVAARHGVDLDDLFDWLERYRSAGRGGLDEA